MNKKRIAFLYIFFDFFAAVFTWAIFFIYRKYNVDAELFSQHFSMSILDDAKFYIGLLVFPLYWLLLHTFTGYYKRVKGKSRLKELETTFSITLIGVLIFFFAFILDDIVNDYFDYIQYFLLLFSAQFVLTYFPRLVITTQRNRKIHKGKIGVNTLIIGSDTIALNTYKSVIRDRVHTGSFILGYVIVDSEDEDALSTELPCLGKMENLLDIVREHDVEELIIAVHNGKRKYIETIITMIRDIHDRNIDLKLIPQSQDFLVGIVKTSSVLAEPLISISPNYMPDWQKYTKRFFDIFLSILAIIILIPVYIFLAIGVKRSSPGPILYSQERIGYRGKPFKIFKFRSMYLNAEQGVPQLSSKQDDRITPFGRFMRKSRLDETPQFFNVLIGDMSLVGPRPERQYYIDQIVKNAPYYKLLLSIKPGITSWGQVKFGYAENVEEMIQRLKWDLLYLENMSLQMDIKILIYTMLIVLERKGK